MNAVVSQRLLGLTAVVASDQSTTILYRSEECMVALHRCSICIQFALYSLSAAASSLSYRHYFTAMTCNEQVSHLLRCATPLRSPKATIVPLFSWLIYFRAQPQLLGFDVWKTTPLGGDEFSVAPISFFFITSGCCYEYATPYAGSGGSTPTPVLNVVES